MLLVDKTLEGRANLIAGANKEDYHQKNLTPGKDFHPTAYADLRAVTAGEACPNCGKALRIDTAVEIGHIFKLGYRYSESMGLRVLDKNGKEVTPIMGSYGIGIERIVCPALSPQKELTHPDRNPMGRQPGHPGWRFLLLSVPQIFPSVFIEPLKLISCDILSAFWARIIAEVLIKDSL